MAVLVLAAGVLLTVALTAAARTAYDQNEDRLLERTTQEAAAVLQASIPATVVPLGQLASIVDAAGDDDPQLVREALQSAASQGSYDALAVFAMDDPTPVDALGEPKLDLTAPRVRGWFAEVPAADEEPLRVIDLLERPDPRLGYVYTTTSTEPVVVYAEVAAPPDRRTEAARGEAFRHIDFALYLGPARAPDDLVFASTGPEGVDGRTAEQSIAFGDTSLLLVASPKSELGGGVLAALPWQVAVAGAIATLVATALVESLHRRRRDAEALAAEVEELYGREHAIAQTLQHSLLPRELPKVAGVELAVRYIPGAKGTEVGGDWYDVIPLDDRRLALVVGDVAGKGVKAASVMAAMRYGTHAIAAQDVAPDGILSRINHLEGIRGDFVTMVCGVLDVDTRSLATSRAGHPCPLVVEDGRARFLDGHVGPPVGFLHTSQYETETVTLAPGATLLLYTDGLYERPGEDLDDGLERLRGVAEAFDGSLQALVDHLCAELVGDEGRDDVALLAVRLGRA